MPEQIKAEIIKLLPRLRKFAIGLTGSPDRGEELVQETCLKAITNAHQWQRGTRLDSWMFRIAKNQWIDTLRAGRRFDDAAPIDEMALPDNESLENSAFSRHHHFAVRAAVANLPPEQRAVVALVCIEGCSYREAADILETPIGTVMSRLARARRSLHQTLYGEDETSEEEISRHA